MWNYEDHNDDLNTYEYSNDEGHTMTEYHNENRYEITNRKGEVIEEGKLEGVGA